LIFVCPGWGSRVKLGLEYGHYPPEQGANGKEAFQSRFRYGVTIERHVLRSGAEKLVAMDGSLRAMRREDDTWIPAHPELSDMQGMRTRVKTASSRSPRSSGR
jgi:hypothetical protein